MPLDLKFLTEIKSTPVAWLYQIVIVTLVVLLLHQVIKKIINILLLRELAKKNPWRHAFLEAISRPLKFGIWIYAILLVLNIIDLPASHPVVKVIANTQEILFIFLVTWFLNRFVSSVENNYSNSEFSSNTIDKDVLIITARLIRIIIFLAAALIFIQWLGYSITGVLALGGIGGLAVSFAAKDLLANFFGGIMIFLDRPFTIGDWIRSPDRNIEGIVEKIGWRITCVMTLDQRPIYIPNAIFTQIIVENPSRMKNRRIYETIGIRYSDLNKITSLVTDIKEMLEKHPDIDVRQGLVVNFNKFSDSSLDIIIDAYTKEKNYVKFHEKKHGILLNIANIIGKHGAEIALPSSTVYLKDT